MWLAVMIGETPDSKLVVELVDDFLAAHHTGLGDLATDGIASAPLPDP
jgi:hypothetical protein